ncbi:MAG: acylphosphatase [Gammaproteobacteria bacterium]|nr:acylphosphatase [Gammaproteobacteria bacterium]
MAIAHCHIFRIEGRVQGVWFRESTRRQAERLGIDGYALNRPDGSVEVLACGSPEALDTLASWLREGPPLARVSAVRSGPFRGDCSEGFSTG